MQKPAEVHFTLIIISLNTAYKNSYSYFLQLFLDCQFFSHLKNCLSMYTFVQPTTSIQPQYAQVSNNGITCCVIITWNHTAKQHFLKSPFNF